MKPSRLVVIIQALYIFHFSILKVNFEIEEAETPSFK